MNTAAGKHRLRPLLWFALLTLAPLVLIWVSTLWHVSTRVQLELATGRIAFTPGGTESLEILNSSVPFSSLVIEDCATVSFDAEKLEIADPRQLVPAAEAGKTLRFPTTAWREVTLTHPVKLSCHDPAAKLTLNSPDPAVARLGVLDRIRFEPGSQVVLATSPGEPDLSLETETPQDLSLALGSNVEFVADFVEAEGIAVPFTGDLLTWRARLPEGRRMIDVKSGEQGLILIVTPARGQTTDLFRKPLDLPLDSVELLEEDRGKLNSPLRDKATLSYPDYPAVPVVTIEQDEVVGLNGLSQARLRSLEFDAEKGLLRARFDGIVERAASRAGAFTRNHRLTLFHTFYYNWRWALIAGAAVWLIPVVWSFLEALKLRK